MGKYRGLNITGGLNANFRKIKVRKTVDTESLEDRGTIAEAASDLPTKGAGHRRGRGALKSQRRAAQGATRGSISMGWITGDDSNVISTHDYGYIFQNTLSNDQAAWETRRALGVAASIADEQNAVATAPVYATGVSLYNSTGIIPAGTPLILNEDGTVSAVAGSAGGSGPYTYTADTNSQEWEVDADYQNQSYPDRWGESWNKIATNGTYTVIGDSLYEELDNGNKTYSGGHAWIIRNSDGAVMKSWNSVVDGDSPNDATLVSFGGTTTGGVTYANSKYNQAAFGNAVAINNNYAFVSAGYIGTNQFGTDPNFGRGELYVISLEDFSLVTVIDKSAAYPDSGSWNAAGSTSWAQQQIILDDNTMVISAPHEDSPDGTTNTSEQEGAIYVYDISGDPANWSTPIIKLTNPIPDNTTDRPTTSIWWNFGNSIAVDFTAQKMVVEWGQINNGHHSAVYDFSSGWSNTPINRRTVAFQAYPGGSFTSLQGDTYYYYTTDTLTLHAVDISQAASGIYTPIWSKQFFGGSYAGGDYINVVLYDESYAYISNVAYDDPTYSNQGQVLVADLSNSGNVIDTIDARQGNMTSERFGYSISLGTGGSLIVAGEKSASVGPNNENLSRMYLYQVGPGAGSTNLTDSNFIGFAKDGFSGASLGKVISFGGIVDGFTGLTVGETYYVQNDGSISLTPSDVAAGPAVSTTSIQVQAPVVNYSYEGSTYTLGAKSGTFSSGPYTSAITLDGNTVFQGFPYEMSPNEESGGLEIYTKDSGGNWSVLQTIHPPLEGANNSFKWRFGATVRVTDDGNRMVTMRTGGVSGYSPGKFYVYDKNETSGLYELTASHQHYSDAGMNNQRFDKSTGYNGLDMSPDGTLIMIHHTKYINSSSGYENWAIVYRQDENGAYQYTDKIQMPIYGSRGSMSGASQWSPTDMSTSGHFIMGYPTWNSFGKAAYAYYDLETGQTYSGLLAANSGTVNAFGKGVAMAGDGSNCAVLDPTWQYQYAQGVAGAVFIYVWDSSTKTYSFSQQLAANDENPSDVLRQAGSILFNSDGSQLFIKKTNSMLIYTRDENGTYVLSEELPNSFVSNGWGTFSSSSDMAWLLCGGGTFGVHGGTSGSAGQSSGNLPTSNSSTWYGDRYVASGGRTSSKYSSIEYIEIATGGSATGMGNMLEAKVFNSSISDSQNYYTIGGQTDAFGHSKLIEYKAFSSTANSSQYGDLTGFFAMGAAGSNGVTGIYAHQYGLLGSYLTGMDWIALGGTSGNSSSLGDLSVGRSTGAGCADATYFVLGGGNYDGGPYAINTTEYLTIANGGTATAGGTLSYGAQANGAASNSTKGVWAGGYSNSLNSAVSTMSVMTLANPSNNATTLGNLSNAVQYPGLSCSSDKVVHSGGYGNNYVNSIGVASIETGGTASNIGTLSAARMGVGAATGNAS